MSAERIEERKVENKRKVRSLLAVNISYILGSIPCSGKFDFQFGRKQIDQFSIFK